MLYWVILKYPDWSNIISCRSIERLLQRLNVPTHDTVWLKIKRNQNKQVSSCLSSPLNISISRFVIFWRDKMHRHNRISKVTVGRGGGWSGNNLVSMLKTVAKIFVQLRKVRG